MKEFAAGVEQLVDRIVTGELGGEVAHQADRYMSGFIKQMENTYSRFERAVQVCIFVEAELSIDSVLAHLYH